MNQSTQASVEIGELDEPVRLFGEHDRNLAAIERLLGVDLRAQGGQMLVLGSASAVSRARGVLERLVQAARDGAHLTPEDVALSVADSADGAAAPAPQTLLRSARGREIRPRTLGQRAFVEAMERNTLTFGIGPAGTGKTFLAVVAAVMALRDRRVARIVLSRPAVEAGEKLGFLPGDLKEKVDPYLRPLYDALALLLDDAVATKYVERGIIEVAPLAYLRGRTLAEAFVILDEAQNTTIEQMKMFLTRLGDASKMVVVGDVTQIDLHAGVRSGLVDARTRFAELDDIGVVELNESDIVRHPLVSTIVRAYGPPRS